MGRAMYLFCSGLHLRSASRLQPTHKHCFLICVCGIRGWGEGGGSAGVSSRLPLLRPLLNYLHIAYPKQAIDTTLPQGHGAAPQGQGWGRDEQGCACACCCPVGWACWLQWRHIPGHKAYLHESVQGQVDGTRGMRRVIVPFNAYIYNGPALLLHLESLLWGDTLKANWVELGVDHRPDLQSKRRPRRAGRTSWAGLVHWNLKSYARRVLQKVNLSLGACAHQGSLRGSVMRAGFIGELRAAAHETQIASNWLPTWLAGPPRPI